MIKHSWGCLLSGPNDSRVQAIVSSLGELWRYLPMSTVTSSKTWHIIIFIVLFIARRSWVLEFRARLGDMHDQNSPLKDVSHPGHSLPFCPYLLTTAIRWAGFFLLSFAIVTMITNHGPKPLEMRHSSSLKWFLQGIAS